MTHLDHPTTTTTKEHNMIRKTLITLAASVVMLAAPGPAFAGQIEEADRHVSKRQVVYVELLPRGKTYFELNDGSTWRFRHVKHCLRKLPGRICGKAMPHPPRCPVLPLLIEDVRGQGSRES